MGKEVEKWECLEQDPCAFGFRVGGIYNKAFTASWIKVEENKVYLINETGAPQIVHTKNFKKL